MKKARSLSVAILTATLLAAIGVATQPGHAQDKRAEKSTIPLIIGHRGGATGYLPDHTLENYALGIEIGADFVEPDLVATKDGVLIARHEPNLTFTTNVSSHLEFAGRFRTEVIDGFPEDGWFARDFTLAEIKTLRAVQPLAERDQRYNGLFQIPTFAEILHFVKHKNGEAGERKNDEAGGRRIGVYPETKHPTYHRSHGLPLEDRLLEELTRAGMNHREAPVFIQSFEVSNLQYLRARTRVKLVQLIDGDDVAVDGTVTLAAPFERPYDFVVSGDPRTFKDLLTPAGLHFIKTYADGIGPWKFYLISTKCIMVIAGACADANGDGKINEADRVLTPPTNVVRVAHAAGLLVHPFTFRNEQRRLASDYQGRPVDEYVRFFEHGVDGVFSDFADTAHTARALFLMK